MKRVFFLVIVCALPIGCSKSSDRPVSTQGTMPTGKEIAIATPQAGRGEAAVSTVTLPDVTSVATANADSLGIANAYPEQSDVLAILHRARELRQQWKFDSALMLVSQALALDPASPLAQSMEREIADLLKRLKTREPHQRTEKLRRTA